MAKKKNDNRTGSVIFNTLNARALDRVGVGKGLQKL